MNSQERILRTVLDLLDGKTLNKNELSEQYGVSERMIRRDIQMIEDVLKERYLDIADEDYDTTAIVQKNHFDYSIEDNPTLLRSRDTDLNDLDLMILGKILVSSRALSAEDTRHLIMKLANLSTNAKDFNIEFLNTLFHYVGVPETDRLELKDRDLLSKIKLINQAIEEGREIEFDYEKNFVRKRIKRRPESWIFSDIYFFMISARHDNLGNGGHDDLNKFRVNNMENITLLSKKRGLGLGEKERFMPGILHNETGPHMFLGEPQTIDLDFYYEPAYVYNRWPNHEKLGQVDKNVTSIRIHTNTGPSFIHWALSQSCELRIKSPQSAIDELVDRCRRMLRYYGYEVKQTGQPIYPPAVSVFPETDPGYSLFENNGLGDTED